MRNVIWILLITLTITAVVSSAVAAADRHRTDSEYGRKTLTGVVTDVNPVRLELSVTFDGRGAYRVRSDEAVFNLDGHRVDFRDIRKGDPVRINGDVRSDRSMDAYTIDLLDRNDRRYEPDRRPDVGPAATVVGEVSRAASLLDRNLTVRTPVGDRKLSVPRDAEVRRDGRSISIHNIKKGETLKATGSWSGNTLVARDVEVTSGRNQHDGYFGRVDRIDYTSRQFRLTGRDGDYWISARDAEVLDDGGRHVSVRELKNGQNVWVYGERRGDTIYADRVERGEYYYQTSKDYKPTSHSTR